ARIPQRPWLIEGLGGIRALTPNSGSDPEFDRLLEVLAEAAPDAVVVGLQLLRFEREARGAEDVARLPHEGEGVLDLVRLELGGARALEGRDVRPVRREAVVQRDAARQEAFGL